jgi:hypothetical protein
VYGFEQSFATYWLAEKIHCAALQCPLARGLIIAGCHEDHWCSVIRNGGGQLTLEFESAYPRQAYVENETCYVVAMSER